MIRASRRTVLTLVVFAFAVPPAHAQTVDEIIAKNIAAKGGAERWNAISSVKMTGRIDIPAMGKDLPLTTYAKRPDSMRQEVVVKGTTMVQAFDGATAWVTIPRTGEPRALPAPVAENMRNSAEFDGPLMNHRAMGHQIELIGKEQVGSADTWHLKVTMKNGQVRHYYLDAETGLERKVMQEVPAGPATQTLETTMSDYRKVDGIMVPHRIEQRSDGKPVTVTSIDKVEFNTGLDDALFRMPGK